MVLAYYCGTLLTDYVQNDRALQALVASDEPSKWRLKQSSYLHPTELVAGSRQATVLDELHRHKSVEIPRCLKSAGPIAPTEAGANRGPKLVPGDQTLKRVDCAKAYARDSGLG